MIQDLIYNIYNRYIDSKKLIEYTTLLINRNNNQDTSIYLTQLKTIYYKEIYRIDNEDIILEKLYNSGYVNNHYIGQYSLLNDNICPTLQHLYKQEQLKNNNLPSSPFPNFTSLMCDLYFIRLINYFSNRICDLHPFLSYYFYGDSSNKYTRPSVIKNKHNDIKTNNKESCNLISISSLEFAKINNEFINIGIQSRSSY